MLSRLRPKTLNIIRFLAAAIIIFSVELGIMGVLQEVQYSNEIVLSFIDAFLVTITAVTVLYYLFFKPYVKTRIEHRNLKKKIQ